MVVKNTLKSQTIESLSKKLAQMTTNPQANFNSAFNKVSNATLSATQINMTSAELDFTLTGNNLDNYSNYTNWVFTGIYYYDKIAGVEINVDLNFSLSTGIMNISNTTINFYIDDKKIILEETFDSYIINVNTGVASIKGLVWKITDDQGGVLELGDISDMTGTEFEKFSTSSLESIVDDSSTTGGTTNPDLKFAIMDDSNNIIKVTINNKGEFEVDSSGNLVIEGFGGNDKIAGTSGNDYIDGGIGADIMNGGLGDDTYIIDNLKDMVKEAALQGTDTILYESFGAFSLAKLANVENLTYEGLEYSFLTGNKLNNILIGGSGENDLLGGLGNDTLTGNAGVDYFIFNTKLGSTNVDTITDFVSGEDVVILNPKIFKKIAKSFTEDNFVTGSAAVESNDYLIFDTTTDDNFNTLYFDADGSGAKAAQAICIVGATSTITYSDIEIG